MFTVEWLKGQTRIHSQAMFGDSAADVVRLAKAEISRITTEFGVAPDAICVTDQTDGKAIVEKL